MKELKSIHESWVRSAMGIISGVTQDAVGKLDKANETEFSYGQLNHCTAVFRRIQLFATALSEAYQNKLTEEDFLKLLNEKFKSNSKDNT